MHNYARSRTRSDSLRLEQYQLFDTSQSVDRVFVANMDKPQDLARWFLKLGAASENLIKEVNRNACLIAYSSNHSMMSANYLQMAMLTWNLSCWLERFDREEPITVESHQAHPAGCKRGCAFSSFPRVHRAPCRTGGSQIERSLSGRRMSSERRVRADRIASGSAPVLSAPPSACFNLKNSRLPNDTACSLSACQNGPSFCCE
jgi:hypothetical protein